MTLLEFLQLPIDFVPGYWVTKIDKNTRETIKTVYWEQVAEDDEEVSFLGCNVVALDTWNDMLDIIIIDK